MLSQNGLTALHLAAQDDHVPVAQALVDARAELDPSTKVLSPLSSFALLSNEYIREDEIHKCIIPSILYYLCCISIINCNLIFKFSLLTIVR